MLNNGSPLEFSWTGIAILGFVLSCVFVAFIYRSTRAVDVWIEDERAVRWGPRHRFVLAFLGAVGILILIWVGFIALGVNAILNPPPAEEIRAAASERAGWILVVLEILIVVFLSVLFYAWMTVGGRSVVRSREAPHE
jgi:hypothetical protein